jgi:hypothetical protein
VGGSTDASVVLEGSARPSASRWGLRVSMMNAPSCARTELTAQVSWSAAAGRFGMRDAAGPASASAPSMSPSASTYDSASRSPLTVVSASWNCLTVLRPCVPPVSIAALTDATSPTARTDPTTAYAAASGTIDLASPLAAGVAMVIVVPL